MNYTGAIYKGKHYCNKMSRKVFLKALSVMYGTQESHDTVMILSF